MSPGFLQPPAVLSLYNKLGNEDTDSSYHPLTLFLPPLAIVACYLCCSIPSLLPAPCPARTRAIHMQIPVPSLLSNIGGPQYWQMLHAYWTWILLNPSIFHRSTDCTYQFLVMCSNINHLPEFPVLQCEPTAAVSAWPVSRWWHACQYYDWLQWLCCAWALLWWCNGNIITISDTRLFLPQYPVNPH